MIRSILRLFTVPNKLAMLGLMRGMSAQMELMTATALLRCRAIQHLRTPQDLDELCAATGIDEKEILRHLLDLGVQRKLLRRRGGRYTVRSRMARCIAADDTGPLASMLQEVTTYHHEVFDQLPYRLRGQESRDYLDPYGELVARSSRIMAPWICSFMQGVLGQETGKHILELGCGTGAYLTHYAELHQEHRGVGIDFDAGVVTGAQRLMKETGLADRFTAQQGDMRQSREWPTGLFDVVTAHQNVYYFDADQRKAIWKSCNEHLTDTGELAIVTPTSGGPISDYFSLILLSTAGCHSLPSVDQLVMELSMAGLKVVRQERLIPGDAMWGISAVKCR
ncbi:MAG: class I SAM-dependent methyltransferase [Sulfitobacter sp.]|nr:class I SAM-dependent methyltransferase [Sulfitobacter sp.]